LWWRLPLALFFPNERVRSWLFQTSPLLPIFFPRVLFCLFIFPPPSGLPKTLSPSFFDLFSPCFARVLLHNAHRFRIDFAASSPPRLFALNPHRSVVTLRFSQPASRCFGFFFYSSEFPSQICPGFFCCSWHRAVGRFLAWLASPDGFLSLFVSLCSLATSFPLAHFVMWPHPSPFPLERQA